jgi:hypothetical protein
MKRNESRKEKGNSYDEDGSTTPSKQIANEPRDQNNHINNADPMKPGTERPNKAKWVNSGESQNKNFRSNRSMDA